jgi:aspartyl protease family protein
MRSRRRWRLLGIPALMTLLLSGAAAVFLVRRAGNAASALEPPVKAKSALEEKLDKEPCDRSVMYDFEKELLKNHESRLVIERSNEFLARCGDDPRIRVETYFAYGNLNEWDDAAAVMTKLIESDPNDDRYWTWRGAAYDKKGDLSPAAADYRQALAIKPSLTTVPFPLARIYESMRTPCEGIGVLEQFLQYNPTTGADRAKAQLDRLYAMDSCKEVAGSGHALVRFPAGAKVVIGDASVEGHAGKFIIDTGASYVGLTETFVKTIGLDTSAWQPITLSTPAGPKKSKLGTVRTLEIQGSKAGHVGAVVIDDVPGVQGLLGVSFLSRFVVTLDPGKGILELKPRRANDPGKQ